MSIKTKAILLVSLIILILSAINFYMGLKNSQEVLKAKVANAETKFDEVVNDLTINTFAPYSSRIITFANVHPNLIKAFAERDRDRLFQEALPFYLNLQRENPFFHTMPFVLPDGTMFLRMHRPEYYGDDLRQVRPVMEAVHKAQVQITGVEVGRVGAFYRTVQPLFYEGSYIGAMEFGIQVEQVVSRLQKTLKVDVAQYYSTKKWAKATKREDFQKKLAPYTILTTTHSQFSKLPDNIDLRQQHQEIDLDGKTFILHSHPVLKNYLGETIGGFVALQDISIDKEQRQNFIINSSLVSGGLLLLAFFTLYMSFGKLIGKLELSRQRQDELLCELQDKIVIQKKTEAELRQFKEKLEHLVGERTAKLEIALSEVKTLSGFLPICASCKKIRDDEGFWEQMEVYISDHSEAQFSHSICPDCTQKLYPEFYDDESP